LLIAPPKFFEDATVIQECLSNLFNQKTLLNHGDPLNLKYMSAGHFQLIPCALGSQEGTLPFFVIHPDAGCSSLFRPIGLPKNYYIQKQITVPVYTLKSFFDLFPFELYPYIEYIKLDAQGADLDILKGAGNYLEERVVYITVEPEDGAYAMTRNSIQEILLFLTEKGFKQVYDQDTGDPTFLNQRFEKIAQQNAIRVYQRG
jgi:FkbM family methyltransferase